MATTAALGWWYARTNDEDSQQAGPNGCSATNGPSRPRVLGRTSSRPDPSYDEFQPWDWRLSGQGGIGCKLLSDETFDAHRPAPVLGGQPRVWIAPPGCPRRVHAVRGKWNGRSTPATRYVHPPSRAVDMEKHRQFPAPNLKAWYEVVLDPEHAMSLKLGVEDRWEHSPGPGREEARGSITTR